MLLEGSHVLLTGATGALGTPLAGELRAAGARLTVSARPGAGLTALADRLGATAAPADLTRAGEAAALVAAAEATVGPLDVVVAGAGAEAVGRFGEVAPADVERALALNLRAPVDLVQAALPGLLARGRGLVVLVSSVAGSAAVPGLGVYGATKAGLAHVGEALRLELRGSGVGVLVVQPGPLRSPMMTRIGADPVVAAALRRLRATRLLPDVDPATVARATVLAMAAGRPRLTLPRRVAPVTGAAAAPSALLRTVLLGTDRPSTRTEGVAARD